MDLETLDAWLEQLKPAPKVDGVSMLDGYLAAIVVGPCSIPPHEWFFDLLGEKGNIATAHGKRLDAIMAIAARFNAIGEILSTTPSKYAPIFQRTDDGVVFAGPWCMGFVAAMKLRWKAWAPLLEFKKHRMRPATANHAVLRGRIGYPRRATTQSHRHKIVP